MSENIFLIHGAYGSPNENWMPWLKERLEACGLRVEIPHFPTPCGQSLENWMKVFEGYKDMIDENTLFVGHSLGPAFILSLLEIINHPIKAAFFIAPFVDFLDNPEFDMINDSFINKSFDWEKIQKNCSSFSILHSDNDPYVDLENAKEVAEHLSTEVEIIHDAGHFNAEAGYDTFPLLLEHIQKIIKK